VTGPAPALGHGLGGSKQRARRPALLPRHGTGRPRPHPARVAWPGPIVLAGVLTAALAAAAFAALTLAAPAAGPVRAVLTADGAAGVPAARPSPSLAGSPGPSSSPAAPAAGMSSAGCGFLDVSCEIGNAVTSWFAALARDALKPLLTLVGETLLSSPQAGAIPAVHSMWTTSLAVADSAYVLLAVIGGVIVMGHETLQTSYSVKDIAPRLVTGFFTANLSLVLISQATSLANALSAALAGHGVTPATAAAALLGTLTAPLSGGGVFLVLLALAAAVLALVLVVVYVLRLMALVLLTAAAPLALACYALPQTAWAARWWWRALTACLAIQVAQALVLTAAVRVFSSAGWIPLNGASPSLLPVLTALCLLYIMMRIPWWISRPVLASFGPSPIRRAARFAFYAAVLSRVSPLLHGAAAGMRPPSGGGGQGRMPAGPRGGGPGGGPRGGGPRGGGPGGGGPRGAGPGRQSSGASPQPGGAGPGGAPGGTGGQPRGMPAAGGGAGPKRQSSGPGPQPAGRPRGGACRGGTMPRQAQGGAVPAGSRPAPGRAGQAWPPLPGMPPRPRTPRPAKRVLPFEVTRVPRSGAPGPRPAPEPPQRPARPRPAQPPLPGMPGRARPPRQLQLPLGPPPARHPRAAGGRPQPRQAPASPGAALPGR
jgi:hypothetical protein